MFITREDDEHKEAIHRRIDHPHFEGSRGWPARQRAVPEVQHLGLHLLTWRKKYGGRPGGL